MASTRIEARDIIDSEGILTQLSNIEKGLDGLKGSLKGIAVDKKIKLSEIISTKGFEEASRQVAMLSDALTKLEKAYEVNREAIKNISEALKVQAVASAAATEASERASAASVKTNKLNEIEIKTLNALKKAIEDNDESSIKLYLTMGKEYESLNLLTAQMKLLEEEIKKKTQAETKNDSLVKTLVDTHRKLKEQITSTKEALDLQKAKTNQLNQVVDKHNKLQGKELQDLQNLRLALESGGDSWVSMVKNMKDADFSYNQLSATYTALKDKLNSVHISDIQQVEDYDMLQKKLKELYDRMNEYQQSTGKFQLNVGRYRSAFDGLGFSIQQVLREVPSAINLNQFFLAISNNIPQVIDQMKLFNRQQKELAINLEEIKKKQGEQSKEYQEGLKQQMSLGKKFLTTIFSWQTAILAGLMILRNWEKITNKLSSLFSRLTEQQKMLNEVNNEASGTIGEMTAKYVALQKEWKNLEEAQKEGWIKSHANDWNDLGIEINSVSDAENVYVRNTKNISNAIDARARSIAAMKLATEKYQEAFKKRNQAEKDLQQGKMSFGSRFMLSLAGSGMSEGSGVLTQEQQQFMGSATNQAIQEYYKNAMKEVSKIEEEARSLIMNFVLPDAITKNENTKGGKTSTPSEQDITDKYWEAEEQRIRLLYEGYEEEYQLAVLAHKKELAELDNWLKEQSDKIAENVANGFISQKDADAQIALLTEQRNKIVEGLNEEHLNKLDAMTKQHDIDEFESELKKTDVVLKHTKRRIKTRTDEVENNKVVMENIATLQNQLLEIENTNTHGWIEEEKKKEEAIKKVNEQLQKQKDLLKFDQQLKNYKNIWQIVGLDNETMLGKAFGGDKKGWLSFLGIEGVTDENADVVFEQWINSAGEALKGFGSEVKDFLGGMLDTWGDYFEKQAEMAQNNTDQAKEYWQTQIELQKQGYANEVNTAWATYQEKLKIQQATEQKARQWAATSQYLADIESGASMAVAVANILKDFTKIPGLGIPLAAGAVTALLSMWATYKSKVQTYGEGGYEPLVGGSHASGHDIDMGFTNRRGRRVHTEGGEAFGVFNRRAVKRYGHDMLGGFVDMANSGRLALRDMSKVDGNLNFVLPKSNGVSLSKVEKLLTSVDTAVNSTTYIGADGRIIVKNGNNVKRIRR